LSDTDFKDAPETSWLREKLTGAKGHVTGSQNKAEAEALKELDTPSTGEPMSPAMGEEGTAHPKPMGGTPGGAPDLHLNHVNSAVSSLEQALTAVGSSSAAGRAILDTLRTLSKHFGDKKAETPSVAPELRSLMGGQK